METIHRVSDGAEEKNGDGGGWVSNDQMVLEGESKPAPFKSERVRHPTAKKPKKENPEA
jgi:hypothetical protein